jgi:hypothetical protein
MKGQKSSDTFSFLGKEEQVKEDKRSKPRFRRHGFLTPR